METLFLLLGLVLAFVTERPLSIPEVVDIQKVFSLAANKGDISSYNFLPLGRSVGTPGFWRNGTEANWVSVEGQMYDRLYDNLLKNYNPETIPMKSADTPVVLKFGVSLINVRSIDTDTGDASFDVWIQYSWDDGRLTWLKRKYNKIDNIRLKPDRIWRPDIELYNGEMEIKENLAVINSDGHIDHIPKTVMSLRCDVTNYTEDDTVTCSGKFGSWTYDGQKIDLELQNDYVDFSDFISVRWDVESSSLVRHVKHYTCCPEPYPDVTVTLVLRDNKKNGWSFF